MSRGRSATPEEIGLIKLLLAHLGIILLVKTRGLAN